jgi:phosphoglycolate phosphatase-like HAD superfamily hydrolase
VAISKYGTVIFDVDGTLCDVRSIRYHVDPLAPGFVGRKNFNRFHAESEWAPINRWVKRLLLDLSQRGFRIAIVTGREGRWAELTERWLEAHDVRYDTIFYRPENDERKDADVKIAHLDALRVADDVVLAVDDSPQVIEMWNEHRVPVIQVSWDANPVKLNARNLDLSFALRAVLKKNNLLS